MKKRFLAIFFVLIMGLSCVVGCSKVDDDINQNLDLTTPITLRIVSGSATWESLDAIITGFETKYPNCTIAYEYVQDYNDNLVTRLDNQESVVDIFTTKNIQTTDSVTNKYVPYAFDLNSRSEILDLSQTNTGLVDNFRLFSNREILYSIPYGGEMRGLYVNKTILNKCNLDVPTNREEFYNCCEVIKKAGYFPIYSSVDSCAQQLLYPYICNLIVNNPEIDYETMYSKINNIDSGISECFRDAYGVMYELVSKGYYDYKTTENAIAGRNNVSKASLFLNVLDDDGDGVKLKKDDVGQIAFMPDTQSMRLSLEEVKNDYNSAIEYEFIMSPVGVDGGYAYLSPTDGFAINKNSNNLDWALEFLDYFFKAENNKAFCAIDGKLSNTNDTLANFENVSAERTCNLGQVTFSYAFYRTIVTPLGAGVSGKGEGVDYIGISKMNAPNYMVDDGLGGKKFAFTLDDYIEKLENAFQALKA